MILMELDEGDSVKIVHKDNPETFAVIVAKDGIIMNRTDYNRTKEE